jgi:hypothetical protein
MTKDHIDRYAVDHEDLARLKGLASLLYNEWALTADGRRDLANLLRLLTDRIENTPIKE